MPMTVLVGVFANATVVDGGCGGSGSRGGTRDPFEATSHSVADGLAHTSVHDVGGAEWGSGWMVV